MPDRIQRKRTKGWRMPPNTVCVTRPGKWGNPFYIINEEGWPWITDSRDPSMPVLNSEVAKLLGVEKVGWREAQLGIVELFRTQCVDNLPDLAPLRGKNLACFCKPTHPCHADVLLKIANP